MRKSLLRWPQFARARLTRPICFAVLAFSSSSIVIAEPLIPPAPKSVVAYDTITGNAVTGGGDWFGYNPPFNANYVVGLQFVPTATGIISGLDLSMYYGGAAGPVNLGLYSDNAGKVGALIENLAVNASGNFDYYNLGPYATGSYSCGATILAGQPYWLVTPFVSPLGYWESMAVGSPTGAQNRPYELLLNLTPGTVGSLTGDTLTGDGYLPGGSNTVNPGLQVTVYKQFAAPELDWTSAYVALTLMLGGLAVLLGSRKEAPKPC